ncbi:MAG: pentapeptide repeat-containing protein [Candidatus Krumholzibacteriota bacterium]|nr:pentapeptide repeat-containing protein [Candidatus Krumholzibacteriota bacterium]
MADAAHKKVLQQGVSAWNKWRQENPAIKPDLSETNIKIRKLSHVNFKDTDLRGALLAGVDLRGANLENADLSGADLMEANLQDSWLSGASLRKTNLMGANLKNADLTGANFEEAIFYRADLKNSECVYNYLWLNTLMDFAHGLIDLGDEEPLFEFEDTQGTYIDNSFVSTSISRLEIVLSDPVSTKAIYEILGSLNRLYNHVSQRDLPGPIIKIGMPE